MGPEGQEYRRAPLHRNTDHRSRRYGRVAREALEGAAAKPWGFISTFGRRGGRNSTNTFDAHRLLHWAAGEGEAAGTPNTRCSAAYFSPKARDPEQSRCVGQCGRVVLALDEQRARQILGSGRIRAGGCRERGEVLRPGWAYTLCRPGDQSTTGT